MLIAWLYQKLQSSNLIFYMYYEEINVEEKFRFS